MASVSSPVFSSSSSQTGQNPRKPLSMTAGFFSPPPSLSPSLQKPFPPSSRSSNFVLCRCQNRSESQFPYDDFILPRWESLQEAARNALKWWNGHLNTNRSPMNGAGSEVAGDENSKKRDAEDWDWDRWKRHFVEVEEQERIVSVLKDSRNPAAQYSGNSLKGWIPVNPDWPNPSGAFFLLAAFFFLAVNPVSKCKIQRMSFSKSCFQTGFRESDS